MQSRRHEDFTSQSSFGRSRRSTDLGPDGYLMASPRSKRSLSPRRMEAPVYSERVLSGHRSSSLERRRVLDDNSRRVRSRSPPYMEAKRRGPFYNDDMVAVRDLPTPERRSRYEFVDRMEMKHRDVDSSSRNAYDYGRGSSRAAVIDDKYEGRRLDSRMGEMVSRKLVDTGVYRSTGDIGHASKTETGGNLSSAPLNISLGQIPKERAPYPDIRDSYSFDKFTDKYAATKQHGDMEKSMIHLRETHSPYSNLPPPRSKEPMGASLFKDYARTSPRKSRVDVDHLGYRGNIPLPRDNHPLNTTNMNIPDPLSHSRYEQRQQVDPGLEINEDMAQYRRERFSPPRTGQLDSMRLQPRIRERVDYLYPSDDIYEKINIRERMDYNDRDMLKPNLMDHIPHRAETSDISRRNMNSRSSLDHLTAANNIGLSRSPGEKRESVQYLDPASVHSRLGRKIPREHEIPYMGMPEDREIERIERIREDYDYNRDVGTGSHKERMRSPQEYLYETERLRIPERTHKMEGQELSPYDSSSRFLKRKYIMDDEEIRVSSRSMISRLDIDNRRQNRAFNDDEWIELDPNFTKRRDHRRVDNDYDERDPITEEWYASHDPEEYYDHHPMKSYKYEEKYAKGYPRSGGRGGSYNNNNFNHPSRRNVSSKWKNMSARSEIDMYADEMEQFEGCWGNSGKSEPREDSEEFKKLVHGYFLSFTKKLNDMPGIRRRYMEQGRAGSLFCIVCGRSLSKEFMDTERLAMHAFMSRKVGLRAQHIGLHRAICVMLGWNGAIPYDTIRWYPETLSSSQTLVQKEDLIIWPPVVVVHNISILNNDSNGQGPTTVEALGQFLRGKGLSGGKIKLGKPANCSIMLIKFLGTFSGLQEAEKIHQYFAKNKHGRKHLDQITSSKGKSKGGNDHEEGKNGNSDEEAERVLFGYMGIAEDLEKVDIDTKRKCSIKSKKEIQDLADGPVKPE